MKKNICIYALVLIILTLLLSRFCVSRVTYQAQDETYLTPAQEAYLGTLRFCESRGYENDRIIDSNKKFSYKPYMFQMDTFLEQGKLYGVLDKNLTDKQAEKSRIIYDRKIQEKIAYFMLLDGKQSNWLNCYRTKLNREPFPKN
ncbi:MAG: hypothetical protein WCO07_01320 [bacterium]